MEPVPVDTSDSGEVSNDANGKVSNSWSGPLAQIKNILISTDDWIEKTLESLGWTEQHLQQFPPTVQCPVDGSHYVQESGCEAHAAYCHADKLGCSRQIMDETQSSKLFYEKAPKVLSIDLDEELLKQVIASAPQSSAADVDLSPHLPMLHAERVLTQQQRQLIYQHCVAVARKAESQVTIPRDQLQLLQPDENKGKDHKSHLELRAEERDMKRRRQTYRGKSTHSAKKSYLEVIKEVISTQTQMLGQLWEDEQRSVWQEENRQSRKREDGGKRKEYRSEGNKTEKSRKRDTDSGEDGISQDSTHHRSHRKREKRGKRSRSGSSSSSRSRDRDKGRHYSSNSDEEVVTSRKTHKHKHKKQKHKSKHKSTKKDRQMETDNKCSSPDKDGSAAGLDQESIIAEVLKNIKQDTS